MAAEESRFTIIERLDARQVEQLHALYQGEWWSKGRHLEDVERMLDGTDLMVGLVHRESGDLAAYARAITDFVYKAVILDVIVSPALRGEGLGQRVLDTILSHEKLREVRHVDLYCLPDLMPFYERWGFTAELGEVRFLRLERGEA